MATLHDCVNDFFPLDLVVNLIYVHTYINHEYQVNFTKVLCFN
jgi:hypothetical protein